MREMQRMRKCSAFRRILGNLLEVSEECHQFSIVGNVQEDSGECLTKILGNVQEDLGE